MEFHYSYKGFFFKIGLKKILCCQQGQQWKIDVTKAKVIWMKVGGGAWSRVGSLKRSRMEFQVYVYIL